MVILKNIIYFLEHEKAKSIYNLDIIYQLDMYDMSILNTDKKYRKIHIYILGLINVVYHSIINNNIVLIGTIGKDYKKLDHDINNEWFIMYSDSSENIANYTIYQTLLDLLNDIDSDLITSLELYAQKYIHAAIIIQKYFHGWKARMKYRYNPETRLCKWLLVHEFSQIQ